MKKTASIKAEMSLSTVVLSMRISEYSFPQQYCFQLPLVVQANYAFKAWFPLHGKWHDHDTKTKRL